MTAEEKQNAELEGVAFAASGIVGFCVGMLVGAGITREQIIAVVDQAYSDATATQEQIDEAMSSPPGLFTIAPSLCEKCKGEVH